MLLHASLFGAGASTSPVPVQELVSGSGIGLNTVTIRGHDGDASAAYERSCSWLFVDEFNFEAWADVGVRFVNEPQSGLLAVLALAAFTLPRRMHRAR